MNSALRFWKNTEVPRFTFEVALRYGFENGAGFHSTF